MNKFKKIGVILIAFTIIISVFAINANAVMATVHTALVRQDKDSWC